MRLRYAHGYYELHNATKGSNETSEHAQRQEPAAGNVSGVLLTGDLFDQVGDVGSLGSARLLGVWTGLEGGDWSAATLFLHVLKRVIHPNPSPTLPVLAWAKADLKEQRSSERDET
ncbi:hypothetical protein PABG_11506 [Paracoccidioides brasiliensis Pb03]|nr:hypothetical protein PABG_11506 [Paracoccidioides brasiliensis Pb03]